MKALIFSGGDFHGLPDYVNTAEYDIIIGADKGYFYAESLGIIPHIFVGDSDSLPKNTIVKSKTRVNLKCEKDMTDTQEAIDIAIREGATHITITAALGGRADHHLANIHLLKYAYEHGAQAEIADLYSYITLVTESSDIKKRDGYCLSLIPLTDCHCVSVSGVYYPLDNAHLSVGSTLGVSNEFVNDSAKISVGKGFLLAMVCKS